MFSPKEKREKPKKVMDCFVIHGFRSSGPCDFPDGGLCCGREIFIFPPIFSTGSPLLHILKKTRVEN